MAGPAPQLIFRPVTDENLEEAWDADHWSEYPPWYFEVNGKYFYMKQIPMAFSQRDLRTRKSFSLRVLIYGEGYEEMSSITIDGPMTSEAFTRLITTTWMQWLHNA